MMLPLESPSPVAPIETSDVSIIRREFVELTGDHFSAVILNQLLYWTLRVKDFDRLLEEERYIQPDCNISPRHGWIYKTAQELNEETMLGLSPPSIRKYLKHLIDQEWVDERNHPTAKWDRTTQYRVNLRKLQEDLSARGYTLPQAYLKAFVSSLPSKYLQGPFEKTEKNCNQRIFSSNQRNFASSENIDASFDEEAHLPREIPNQKFFDSNKRNFSSNENPDSPCDEEDHFLKETLNQRNFASNEKNFGSNERIFASNEKFFGSNTENTAKTTSENINREQQQDACVRENFSDGENSKNLSSENFHSTSPVVQDKSVAAEMCDLWKQHVEQHFPAESDNKRFRLTMVGEDKLESLFAFHFKNDISLWKKFCLQVEASPFLMGDGGRTWHVDLDWVLKEGNVSKILSGKYDNFSKPNQGDSFEVKLEKIQPSSLNAEKAAILDAIKDPVWKKWCTKLATGVPLNDFKMLHEPLSTLQLQQIANAYFLEVEDGRLVWVASSDQGVLNAIENLRLQISWVCAKEYPKARTIRTRLDSETFHLNTHHNPKGENSHD
jgi:hypothetical protein